MPDDENRAWVFILTDQYRIRGQIALLPGVRLTDYMCAAKLFIAVLDVEVEDLQGRRLLQAAFLNVHRDHIRLIAPADLAVVAPRDAAARES
ncbi:MAG: hypothetical protein NTV49_06445 [Kiritimatiellaeota bacterium]|nr:hypothetical protein [Kiritimatiellota bacterium]